MFEPYTVLKRALEREEALLWNLRELLVSLDQSGVGPASAILPRWQLERIEAAIAASEEEMEMLSAALEELDDDEFV
jgi:hypothetical protein